MVNPASVLAFLTKFGAKEALKKFKPNDIKKAVSTRNQQVIGEWDEVFKKGKIKDVDFDKERENLKRAVSAGKSDTSVFSKNIQATTGKAAPLLDEVYRGEKSFVDFNKAIPSPEKFTFLPEMTSPVKMKAALDSGKRSNILGDANNIKINDGEIVGARLDIPAYTNSQQWVNSLHYTKDGKRSTAYSPYTYLKGDEDSKVIFGQHSEKAFNVATGKKVKTPFAKIEGKYKNISPQEIKDKAEAALEDSLGKNPTWTQVSFNPVRSGSYTNRLNPDQAIQSADEMIQIGPLVLAKNAKMVSRSRDLNKFEEYSNPTDYRKKILEAGATSTLPFVFEEGGVVNSDPNTGINQMNLSAQGITALNQVLGKGSEAQEQIENLEDQGRYGDDTLVHMSEDEVAGLASLSPTGITQNPQTGLPEMFSLRKLLGKKGMKIFKTVAPAALAYFGAPVLASKFGAMGLGNIASKAAADAAISFGSAKLTGANSQEALNAGLTAGFTSGLMQKLMPSTQMGQKVRGDGTEALADPQRIIGERGTGLSGEGVLGAGMPKDVGTAAAFRPGIDTYPTEFGLAQDQAALVDANNFVPPPAPPPSMIATGEQAGLNMLRPASDPTISVLPEQPGLMSRGMDYAKDMAGRAKTGISGLVDKTKDVIAKGPQYNTMAQRAGSIIPALAGSSSALATEQQGEYRRPTFGTNANLVTENYSPTVRFPTEEERKRLGTSEFRYFTGDPYGFYAAEGGQINAVQDGDDFDTSGVQVEGMINGEGDGMSDEIPGVIEGGQNLRVSDGEFIVPADVVSMLGNGSSNAGAKELYDMMDRIRVAKTGKTRQLPETDAEDFLPA